MNYQTLIIGITLFIPYRTTIKNAFDKAVNNIIYKSGNTGYMFELGYITNRNYLLTEICLIDKKYFSACFVSCAKPDATSTSLQNSLDTDRLIISKLRFSTIGQWANSITSLTFRSFQLLFARIFSCTQIFCFRKEENMYKCFYALFTYFFLHAALRLHVRDRASRLCRS